MKKEKQEVVPKIRFHELYPKLKNLQVGKKITTIRFVDKWEFFADLMAKETEVYIWLDTISPPPLGMAIVTNIKMITKSDITPELAREDSYEDWTPDDLWKLLRTFYSRKEEWKGENTRFVLVELLITEVFDLKKRY